MPKKIINIFVISLSLIFIFITSASAAQASNAQTLAMLQKVLKRTQQMEKQMNSLKAEVGYLKAQLQKQKYQPRPARLQSRRKYRTKASIISGRRYYKRYPHVAIVTQPLPKDQIPPHKIRQKKKKLANNIISTAWFLGGTPVFTSPYLGLHSAYDGSDLISQAPTVNLDLRLLKQMQAMEKYLYAHKIPLPEHPIIELSGKVEALASIQNKSPGSTKSDFDLATAEFDIFAQVNPWVYAYMALDYDGKGPSKIRTAPKNSRIFLKQGFITLGNLNREPVYASFGQLFVPFGQYGSFMLSTPMTTSEGRTRERAISVGVHPAEGFYAAGYIFKGDTNASSSRDQTGATLGYKYDHNKFHADVKAGVISNLADSAGMQNTGAPSSIGFGGFGVSTAQTKADPEKLRHYVPGLNIDGKIMYGNFAWLFEYVSALRSFSPEDLAFGHKINDDIAHLTGAKPQTFHTELGYLFNIHGKPANVAIGYGWSKQALALWIPHHSYMGVFNISIWRNTIASFEYRYDDNYSLNDRASGAGSKPFAPMGKHASTFLAQFGIYF